MEDGTLLIDISHTIQIIVLLGERAKHQKANCQNLVVRVKLLKPLFEELRQAKDPLTEANHAALLGLLDALRRLKDTLEKCGPKGSKIYLALRCHQILTRFQGFSLHIDHALSELPLNSLRVSGSSRASVEKCIQELKKIQFVIDDSDEELLDEIENLLKQQRCGLNVSLESLQKLAHKMDVKSNDAVVKELNALREEKETSYRQEDKLEGNIIDETISLFMRLIQDPSDLKEEDAEVEGARLPPDFRCPLSQELMSDPVIVASGQTYERICIQEWLDRGNTTCPKTGQVLAHVNLIPNYTVKALIANWCETHNMPLPEPPRAWVPPENANSSSDGRDIVPAHQMLETDSDDREDGYTEENLSYAINEQTFSSPLNQVQMDNANNNDSSHPITTDRPKNPCYYSGELSCELDRAASEESPDHSEEPSGQMLTQFASRLRQNLRQGRGGLYAASEETEKDDIIKELVEGLQSSSLQVQSHAAAELRLLAKNNMEDRIRIANAGAIKFLVGLLNSSDNGIQENSVTALLNLSLNDNNKAEIAEAGAIRPLVNVLKTGTTEARQNAAATLYSLSVKDEYKEVIGESGAIPPLVDLLINGMPRGKKDAATALFNLSIFPENKTRIVEAGAVKPLIELIQEPRFGMVDKAVSVLANLSTTSEGKTAIGECGGIPALVEVVEAGSPRGKENAAAALLQLCTTSNRYRMITLQEGVIPPLHMLTQSGTARAKEKASAILRLFREQRQGRPASDRHMNRH